MSENHEGLLETSDAAPLKDDDFPGEFFDDSNDVATFEESSSDAEYEASFESNGHVHGLGDGETLASPLPKKPKRVLRAKIGKPEEVPTPGGLIPWTLSVSAFVCIGTFILFGSKPPASTGGTAAAVAPAPAPAESEPTPTATPVVTPVALAEPAKPAETPVATATTAAEPVKAVETPAETVAAATPTPAPTPTPTTAPAPDPTPSPTELLAGELKSTQDRLTALSEKIEALPKPEPPADLKPLEDKVAEQAKSLETMVPLPEKLGKVEESVVGLNTLVTSIKSDLDALKEEIKKTNEALAALATKAAEPAKPSEFDSAAGLFQSGKYKDAQAIFAKLAAENPTDARVFYYAALANGSANNVWNGETETLVNKGIELEKAGTPKVAEIDAAFADLLPQLKTWLGAYRKRVAR